MVDSASSVWSRAAVILALAGLNACAGPAAEPLGRDRCAVGEPPAALAPPRRALPGWGSSGRAVSRLTESSAEILGDSPRPVAPLAAWDQDALAGWARVEHGADLRLRSPDLSSIDRPPAWMELRLRPGGARALDVVLFSSTSRELTDRVSRTTRVILPAGSDSDEVVHVRVNLEDLVGGNWADAWRGARLSGLELSLEGAGDAALEALSLEDGEASYAGAPAGVATLERGGVLRPGWFVHGGARVRLRLEVPPQAPELRWLAGGTAAGELLASGGEDLARAAESGAVEDGAVWTPMRVSLARWAGSELGLELRCEGEGICFFGDPRVISGADGVERPDVLVYLIDALRADALRAWGSPIADVSPNIDRLAAEGAQFLHAYSPSNWTKPVIPTLMSGIWPTRHQVGSQRFTDRLPDTVPLLQERLRDAGWRTGSFSANPLGSTLSGLARGFDAASPPRRWEGQISPMGAPTAAQLHQALLSWLDEEPADRPFFAYVHTLEVHQSYRPPFADPDPRLAYERAIRAADAGLGELLGALRARRGGRPLLLALVSDHGESFGDHGLQTHGTGIYDSQLHVPMLLWASGTLPAARVDAPVSLADLGPTLLDLLGLPPLAEADGLSLRPLLEGEPGLARPFVPSALLRFSWVPDAPRQFAAIGADLRKVIQREEGGEETYDLREDPCELSPLARDAALSERLTRWREAQTEAGADFERRYGAPAPGAVDAEIVQQLRALGYIK